MKRKLLAVTLAALCSVSFAAPEVDIPEDILQKQRHTLQHYGGKSKVQVATDIAEGYSHRIGNMIKSLQNSKARFDQQIKDGSQPVNSYSKYSGVWQLSGEAGTAYCDDGSPDSDTYPEYVGQTTWRSRWTFSPDGSFTDTAVESSPTIPTITLYEKVDRYVSGNQLVYNSEKRYQYESGYINTTKKWYEGTFVNNTTLRGEQKIELYRENYGETCVLYTSLEAIKVSN
jgi:hypothetical protein